jgi:phosphatidylglycerophosphate synthase
MMNGGRLDWRAIGGNVPNAISFLRLAAAPVLLAAVLNARQALFAWLLLACLVSDIVDGLIARGFEMTSQLGARLDSAADMAVFAAAMLGIFVFQGDFVSRHYAAVLCVVGLYVVEVAGAMWRYGRISSFHTVLTRMSAYAQGAFVMSLFLWGYSPTLFRAAIAVSLLAYTEELAIVWMLSEWEADVRGLYWILARRRLREAVP